MPTHIRLLSIACALVFLGGLVGLVVVDDDGGDAVATEGDASAADAGDGDDPASGSTADDTDDAETEDGDGDGDGAGGGDDADDEDDAPPTTDGPAATTTAPSPTTTTPASTAPPTSVGSIGSEPTTPGTYRYRVTGTSSQGAIDGTSTLTVSAVDGNGVQSQRQAGPEGSSTTEYRYAPEGTYLVAMTMSAQGMDLRLTADSPFLVIPADAGEGTSTQGRLSGSGLTADVTFTIDDIGTNRSTARIEADITGRVLNACNVDGTLDSTITARTRDRLPVDTTSASNINVSGSVLCPGRITSDTRTVLDQ